MKRLKKILVVIFGLLTVISLLIYAPIWMDDFAVRRNKRRVHDLIKVGQNLNEAAENLKKAGFRLLYQEPIKPTYDKSYSQQIVIVGEAMRNPFEMFGYAADIPMPFTHSESPYVMINAALDGTITEID